jgi:hypothetical protein
MRKRHATLSGFSVIELLFAGAITAMFSAGVVSVLLFGLATDRLAEETTIATRYAEEGMEAIHSLKAKSFDDLVDTEATGIDRVSGEWVLSGSDNTFQKYTRVIRVEPAYRDGDGLIVESGGSEDADTKKVTVTVSFSVTASNSRLNSVILETFFTRFR